MANSVKVEWTFPEKQIHFMKLEILVIGLLTVVVLVVMVKQFNSLWQGILFTLFFILLYFILSYLIQKVRQVEENYHLSPTYVHITRKTRFKERKQVIPLRSIVNHKLDHFFLGGYLLTDDKKHLLFFNTREEVKAFEEALKNFLSGDRKLKKKKSNA